MVERSLRKGGREGGREGWREGGKKEGRRVKQMEGVFVQSTSNNRVFMYGYMYTTTIPFHCSFQPRCLRPQGSYSPFQFPLLFVQGHHSIPCLPLSFTQRGQRSFQFPLLFVQGRHSTSCLPLSFTQRGQRSLHVYHLSIQGSHSYLTLLLIQTHPCQTSL